MCDFLCPSCLTIVVAFILCSPVRSETNSETKRQRTLVIELRNMISDLFDKADASEAEEEDTKPRGRKSVDEDTPTDYKKAQADNLRKEGYVKINTSKNLREMYLLIDSISNSFF
ncbi:hypothetical protein AVEN_251285-1 [Araneus ventricosus]|uniref:Uncharacterized protein n=1 Tax=Araneus ventricosus TaxID=182803 RepID=A0A4Y2CF04_ARAVE|nr:hypothetical protein AVEN_251285-1 [Araneus ventricosus]